MSILTTLPSDLYSADAFADFVNFSDFRIGNARAAAWLCQLAYETEDRTKISNILSTWNAAFVGDGIVSAIVTTPLPISRTEAFVARRDGTRFIAFAGTDPIVVADWITDFRLHPNAEGVAAGFAEAAQSALPIIRALLNEDRSEPIYVTGHSLGGALAVIAAAALTREGFRIEAVYTYGMPRPGTQEFKTSYDATLGARTYRLVYATDVVPTVPPSALGMRHVGRLLRCVGGAKFDAADLTPDTYSDDPAFIETMAKAIMGDLRRPWDRSARALSAARRIVDLSRARRRPVRGDFVGLMFETLPTALRDHLPDRYIAAAG